MLRVMIRPEAVDYCIRLGNNFINEFHYLYNYNTSCDNVLRDFVIMKMQQQLDIVRSIQLEDTKKMLTPVNMIDWFFTAGASIDKDQGFNDDAEIDYYNEVILALAANRTLSVNHALFQTLFKEVNN